MKTLSSPYLTKLMAYGLLLGTVPVIILGILAYVQSSVLIETKVSKSNMQLLKQAQSSVESELRAIDQSAMNFISTSLVDFSLRRQLTEYDFETVRRIQEGIHHLNAGQVGVDSATLISLDHFWIASNHPGFPSFMHLDGISRFQQLIDRPERSYWTRNDELVYEPNFFVLPSVNKDSPSQFIVLVKKVPIISEQPTGLLLVQVSIPKLNRLMFQSDALTEDREFGDYMILDRDFNVLAHADPARIGESLASQPFVRVLTETDQMSGTTQVSDRGRQFRVNFRKSSYNGWSYISLISISDITRDSRRIAWYTIGICSGICVLIGLISYLGSRRMYHPIRRLYEMTGYPTTHSKDANGTDELTWIGEQFGHLLQSQEQMMSRIHQTMPQLKEYFQFKLLQGEVRRDEIEIKRKDFNFATGWQQHAIMAIQIDNLDYTPYSDKDLDLLLFAISNIVGEIVPEDARLQPVVMHSCQITLLGTRAADAQQFKEELYERAILIQKKAGEYLKLNVSIGIGSFFKDLIDSHNAYKESLEALKYRVRFGQEAILYIEDVRPKPTRMAEYPQSEANALFDSIKLGDSDSIEERFEGFWNRVLKENERHEDYMMALIRLMTELVWLGREAGVNFHGLYSGNTSMLNQLLALKTPEEIIGWFRSGFLQPLTKAFDDKRDSNFRRISGEAIRLIQEKFDSDISLESIAKQLGYHPVYLSKVFRDEAGMNFSDYLARYRLGIAKSWLAETDMTVGEIAERLQYYSPANFSRYFKKLEGITPGRYRELNRNTHS